MNQITLLFLQLAVDVSGAKSTAFSFSAAELIAIVGIFVTTFGIITGVVLKLRASDREQMKQSEHRTTVLETRQCELMMRLRDAEAKFEKMKDLLIDWVRNNEEKPLE